MENPQGIVTDPSAVPQGQGGDVAPSAVIDPNQLQDTSAVPSDAMQGGVQGGQDDINRQEQSALHKERAKFLAEKYAFEQQMQRQMEFQQQQMVQSKPQQQNPYPEDTRDWWRYEMQNSAKMAAEEARRATKEEFGGVLQSFQKQQWLNTHGQEMQKFGITKEHIEAFNSMRGIPPDNYEVGWELMTMPTQLNNVVRQTQKQTINDFRNAQTGANPIRGGLPAGGTPQYSFEADALEYERTYGRIADTWTPERRDAFERELTYRRYNEKANGDRSV